MIVFQDYEPLTRVAAWRQMAIGLLNNMTESLLSVILILSE